MFKQPLRLSPHFSQRPWGGTKLQTLLRKQLPLSGGPYGESWELSDHPDGPSRVLSHHPELSGKAFGEILRTHPRPMIGRDSAPARYPLLVKYIDAAEDLSIQVHPSDQWCRTQRHDDRGKSECWYVMQAEPRTTIIAGYKPGIGESAVRAAIARNSLRDTLQEWSLQTGDFIPLPPGTVHAMMAGTLVCEIQQSSNTTFRLHDWDRKPTRQLHIDESLQVTDWDRDARVALRQFGSIGSAGESSIFENEFFSINRCDVVPGGVLSAPLPHHTGAVINVVEGNGELLGEGWTEQLRLGDTLYLPAALTSPTTLRAGASGLRILRTISREL